MREAVITIGLIVVLTPGVARPFSAKGASDEERSIVGFLAVRGSVVVAAENEAKLFAPASVLKLVVAAAALHHLGPEHRRVTRVVAKAEPEGEILHGDLIVRAAGDSTWGRDFHPRAPRAPLRALAKQIRDSGVKTIDGEVVVDASAFPGPNQPASRPGSERGLAYGAPTSALAVDENVFGIRISAGPRVGEPARFHARNRSFSIENRMVTVSRSRRGRGTVEFHPATDRAGLVLVGEYPLGEPDYALEVSVPDPDVHAGHALATELRAEGIELAGNVRVSRTPVVVASEVVLATFESPPLEGVLDRILTQSDNWRAEMLLRVLGLEVAGSGRIDEGLEVERKFLEQVVGLPPRSFFLDDASGLSTQNLLSPAGVVALLRWCVDQPWWNVLRGALPKRGEGTLAAWGTLPPIRAKTGTIQHTVALAGLLEPNAEEPTFFAAFVNHRLGSRAHARREIARRLRDWSR